MGQLEQVISRDHPGIMSEGSVGRSANAARRRLAALSSWVEAQALFIVGVAAVAAVNLAKVPQHFSQDSWLALVGGRFVAAHGIPSADTLNVMTHGTHWVDQQWLAQLLIYWVDRLGGLFLYGVLYVFLTTAAFGLAIAAGRSLGGSERSVLWVLPAVGFLYVAGSFEIRTQGLAYLLFVAVLWILAKDARARSRRAYLVFPLLIVWANLHGSVTLGVGLAVLYGVSLLVDDLRRGGIGAISRRTGAFLLGPLVCLLVTPYGFSIVGYYRETLLNPNFANLITEWRPVTSVTALAVPCLALAGGITWLLGRSGSRTRMFDQLALIVLAAAAIFAVRNITWFGLGAAMLVPACISSVVTERHAAPRRKTLNLTIAWLSVATLAGAVIAIAARPAGWFESSYNNRTLARVESIAKQQPHARIFADVRYSDWLLWHDPALAGRLAYDTRFELLTDRQLSAIAHLGEMVAPHQLDILAGYRVLVLDRSTSFTKLLLARPGTRVGARNSDAVVALTGS